MEQAAKPDTTAKAGRWAIVAAGAVALAAVGYSLMRGDDAGSTAAVQAQAPAQSVEAVIAGLEQKLADNPDDAEGWRMLGWSYFRTGRYAEAATAFKRATVIAPDNAEYHSMLGEALVLASKDGSGLPADAKAAFDRALALNPEDPRARYFQAVALDLEGKHAEAIDAWFDLLEDTPADAPYAADVRQVIEDVAKLHDIDVAPRLANAKPAPATGGMRTDGSRVATGGIPGPTREQMQQAASLPQGQQQDMVRGMVEGLADRLKSDPNDADGWIMLMRSRMQLGETAKAADAYRSALAAFRNDATQSRRIREAAAALNVPAS